MEALYSNIHYWLVDHPKISQFEWKQGHTFNSSKSFLIISVSVYLYLTHLLLRFPTFIPTLTTTTIRNITAIHSLILCLLSLLMVIASILSVLHQMPPHDWKWIICFPGANHTLPRGPVFFWIYICYLSNILEFIDTLLIVLSSSRSRRLSFLHVYHHTVVPVLGYIGLQFAQSMSSVAVIINASIHVIMYAYYFLSAIGKRPRWKKVVTNCQIVQFMTGFLLSAMMLYYHFTTEFGCTGVRVWCI
ncbi:uncharacterized protein LOC125823283 [Solanum verrucosum]|uniref:uncharacterized protein LOC125823283 n=1 Tax=Solanum verrucosum TaxID=315347 RepID=UPI0020D0096C|nr:uncharacterized protein LOC125823283 [Solanum verrucosum]